MRKSEVKTDNKQIWNALAQVQFAISLKEIVNSNTKEQIK